MPLEAPNWARSGGGAPQMRSSPRASQRQTARQSLRVFQARFRVNLLHPITTQNTRKNNNFRKISRRTQCSTEALMFFWGFAAFSARLHTLGARRKNRASQTIEIQCCFGILRRFLRACTRSAHGDKTGRLKQLDPVTEAPGTPKLNSSVFVFCVLIG